MADFCERESEPQGSIKAGNIFASPLTISCSAKMWGPWF